MTKNITSKSAVAFVSRVTMPEAVAYGKAKEKMLSAIRKFNLSASELLGAVEPGLRETLLLILRDELNGELS